VKPSIIHDEAQAEFDGAISYYEEQEKGLGLRFHREVEQAVEIIGRHPKLAHRTRPRPFVDTSLVVFLTSFSILNYLT
jgi:plasmid stabilization system protein ParE